MTETVEVPVADLRTLVKWAYYAAEYEGVVGLDEIAGLTEPIGALTREIAQRDADRGATPFEQIQERTSRP
jgi:dienelactone hydrolase